MTDYGLLKSLLERGKVGVFCDFDGTISQTDMIAAIMMEFAPDEALPIIAEVKSGQRTVADGVSAMFRLLPSARYSEIEQFAVRSTVIRQGFVDFVNFCRVEGWMFSVVSGGFDFFVEPAVASVRNQLAVFCNRLDCSGPRLEVAWRYPCSEGCDGGCGLCKPSLVNASRPGIQTAIVIGDGVTDFKVAKQADFVFARDKLLELCQQNELPHAPFETFDDIRQLMFDAMDVR